MTNNPNPEYITSVITHTQVYSGLLRAIPQYVLVKDHNKRFVWVSEGFCKFLNCKSSNIIGKTDFDFFDYEVAVKFQADDDKILKKEVERLDAQEEENKLKNAKESKSVLRTKVPLIGAKEDVVGVLCTFTDITDQRKRQERMLKLFVHDTPRPLIIVRDTYLIELGEIISCIENEDAKNLIVKNTKRIDEAIEFTLACCHAYGLLSHSSSESWMDLSRCPSFYLMQIIQLVLSVLKPNTNAKFVLDVPKNHQVKSDKYKIVAILYCLVHNAIRATVNMPYAEILISVRIANGCLALTVADNGPGVQESEREKIFNEGYSRFGSSGIGLYIVKRFTEEAGGRVMPVTDSNPDARNSQIYDAKPGAKFEVHLNKYTLIK